jgi:hypothetical protein
MYSDLSTGDLGENFSESNRQLIGNTYDGEIAGLARVKDSVIAFKDRSLFALDGVLIPGQYSLRKIETDEIGCMSFKSILAVKDSVLFQGQDGIYAINGYQADRISKELDPFFKTIDASLTRSVVNNDLNQYIFWTDQGMAVYDYEFNEWYIWDNIDASSGITVDNDGIIRFFSSTKALKFQDAKNDVTSLMPTVNVPIDAWIKPAWLDLAEPSILKKLTGIRFFALNNAGQNVEVTSYWDWNEVNAKDAFTFNMPSTVKTQLRKLDIVQAQSFSFKFRNNVLNEDLNLSGFDIVCQLIQSSDKNVT